LFLLMERRQESRKNRRNSLGFILCFLSALSSCTLADMQSESDEKLLQNTVLLAKEVKEFGKTLGIVPTQALNQSTLEKPGHSMLWLWLQKRGTLALRQPIDIRLWLRFAATKEQIPLDYLYNISDYSAYYRQGNQFGDSRSAATLDFARDSLPNKVKVVLHEDLHDARNFDLPWDIEESVVTPLAMLAALEFFEHKKDRASKQALLARMEEERGLSKELNRIVTEAERRLRELPLAEARKQIGESIPSYPTYARWYQHQVRGQDPDVVLEAKISHDLAYYRHYDRIVALYQRRQDVKGLIADLKKINRSVDADGLETFLQDLETKYNAPTL
jgi:hypothetical protein